MNILLCLQTVFCKLSEVVHSQNSYHCHFDIVRPSIIIVVFFLHFFTSCYDVLEFLQESNRFQIARTRIFIMMCCVIKKYTSYYDFVRSPSSFLINHTNISQKIRCSVNNTKHNYDQRLVVIGQYFIFLLSFILLL